MEKSKPKIFINNKTKEEYIFLGCLINSTNDQDGQEMIRYRKNTNDDAPDYVREKSEFFIKFTQK